MRSVLFSTFFAAMAFGGFAQNSSKQISNFILADGTMPNIATDGAGNMHIVYGHGDSILYISSRNGGSSFSSPELVAVLPRVYAGSMRGPQIVVTTDGLLITANTNYGNIYSYRRSPSGEWSGAIKVNDSDSTSKEGLMALAADGKHVFAIWLDIRNSNGKGTSKGQRIFGAASDDGGRTWSRNKLIYVSPDTSVCQCCKPSLAMKGSKVYVMFRNSLDGSRDLYLLTSANGGKNFGPAEKLGNGTWKLNGCPMDGGGLAVNRDGKVQTVWRREGKIYADSPSMPEREIGDGRGCVVETVNGKAVYAWVQAGKIVVLDDEGQKQYIGSGSGPIIKAAGQNRLLCVWEDNKQVHAAWLTL